MKELEYQLCDVFTSTPLQGNQLAVFLNANGVTVGQMQDIAREMNLSETTFVVRRDASVERARGIRVRIFTTQEELPFAGHPTLGTAAVILHAFPEYADAESIILDLNAGPIPVRFMKTQASERLSTFGEMTQIDPVFGAEHDRAVIAPILGLQAGDLAEAPQTVSTGVAFCVVVLRSVEALAQLRLDHAACQTYLGASDAKFFYVLAPDGEKQWRARMQFYNGEDPATGSAAGCAISYLVRRGIWPAGEQLHLRQGIEIHRASNLYLSANLDGEKIIEVRVSGSTVPVAKGRLFLA